MEFLGLGGQPGFYQAMNDTANLYFLNFKIKVENVKILNPSADHYKVPSYSIQWNRQKVILFYETSPLILRLFFNGIIFKRSKIPSELSFDLIF
jgi:hypothetical protein